MFIVVIQARMGSTRLPGKVMKKLLDKEIFLWSYNRCKQSNASDVYFITSTNVENDILSTKFEENNIKYFRGSENDLLDRYYQFCIKNSFNTYDTNIIRVTSDCPFVDPKILNDMIEFYKNNNFDYIINHSKEGITPEGSGIEIINFKSLEYLWNNMTDPKFREHACGMLSHISDYDNIIKKSVYVYNPENINIEKMKNIKISVDTYEDYLRSSDIVAHFNSYDFSYSDLLLFLQTKLNLS